jgi:hypothetical protein
MTVEAGMARRLQVGPNTTDTVYLQVVGHAEIIELTAVKYSNTGVTSQDYTRAGAATIPSATDKITVVRGALSTSPESYIDGEVLEPWVPGTDPDAGDAIAGVAQGSVDIGPIAPIRTVSVNMVLNNALEARLDEYGIAEATGVRRTGPRTLSGRIVAYFRQEAQALATDLSSRPSWTTRGWRPRPATTAST